MGKRGAPAKFCFQACCWGEAVPTVLQLDKVFRQSDMTFVDVLNRLRFGQCDRQAEQLLRQCVGRTLPSRDGIEPTKLHSTKRRHTLHAI